MHTGPLRKIPVPDSQPKGKEMLPNQATISTPQVVDEDKKILYS